MKIKAIAPWFGSKRTLAGRIVAELGPHSCFWEIFAGSCAVTLAKNPATYESVNDLHSDWYNLALTLQEGAMAGMIYDRVYRTLFHERLLPTAKQALREQMPAALPNVDRCYWYLVFSWMSLNGVSGTPLSHTGTFAARYSANGGNGATRWRSMVDSIPWWHERLRGVQILNRDAFTILEALDDDSGTVIYADPPYIEKSHRYVHDFTPEEHKRLAAALARFKHCRIVLSYYEHPLLAEMYPGWTKVNCAIAKSMFNSGMRDMTGKREAPEVLLINGPSLTESQSELF